MSIIELNRYHNVKVAIKIFSMLFMRFLKQIDYKKIDYIRSSNLRKFIM